MPTTEKTQESTDVADVAVLPQVGDVVLYRLGVDDVAALQGTASSHAATFGPATGGTLNPFGTVSAAAGQAVPAIVTAVLAPGVVNAQLLPDCPGRMWVGSRTQGPGLAQWEPRS